jgi:hypothetical protein
MIFWRRLRSTAVVAVETKAQGEIQVHWEKEVILIKSYQTFKRVGVKPQTIKRH